MSEHQETTKEKWDGMPAGGQLRLMLENLFERQRLIELAHRCTTRDEDFDFRQAPTHELTDILIEAWEKGPRRPAGSVWGAVDQELSSRLKSYLGLGENRLREMINTLKSEGSYDRKTSTILLWVLIHEKHEKLLEEYEPMLSTRFRDSGSVLASTPLCMKKFETVLEHLDGLGRELKALIIEQGKQIEQLRNRMEQIERGIQGGVPAEIGGSDSASRRLEDIPHEKVRVGVFVDVQNMFYAAKKLDGARLDYECMLDRIVSGRRLVKAVAYIVESSEIDQSGFISVLEKKGYQVRRKELKSFMDGSAKGDWDMGMAIDILEMASYLDVVALVTGDGDFVSLVRLVKKMGPMVELYAFGHNLSHELRETADSFHEINNELLLKSFHGNTHSHSTHAQSGGGENGPGSAGGASGRENRQ